MRHLQFSLENFISEIVGRKESFFEEDLEVNKNDLRKKIDGASVLVIGGAGTIGLSFIKAILRYGKPKQLCIVDTNENGLTEVIRDIRSSTGLSIPNEIITYPISFSDEVFYKIFTVKKPFDIIANFAAHKHVRSEKDVFSIEAMLKNNVINAAAFLEELAKNPPEHFFCVSTDKAANPVNIMGASKKLMEEVIFAYSSKIKVSTARFANVAFSNGSLLYGFLERLNKHQPFSAPKDIRRFFVTPAESGELCMMSCLLGDSKDIFFPKLDPQKDMHLFVTISNKLLTSLGYEPYECATEYEARMFASELKSGSKKYPVYYFSSDTTGEKPYEEFYTEEEQIDLDKFASLGIVKKSSILQIGEAQNILKELKESTSGKNITKSDIVMLLRKYIPNFGHTEKGKTLDERM